MNSLKNILNKSAMVLFFILAAADDVTDLKLYVALIITAAAIIYLTYEREEYDEQSN